MCVRCGSFRKAHRYFKYADSVDMTRILIAASLLATLTLPAAAQPAAQGLIPFKVVANVTPAVALLVAPNPTDEQLTTLLNAFRTARMKGTFAQLIPPTTPKAKVGGPYN